jgi:hypothetical protein
MAKPGPEFFSAFRFTVGNGETEIGVLRVDVGPTADSLRIWRGISDEHQPMFAEVFDMAAQKEHPGSLRFCIHLFNRNQEKARTYRYECEAFEVIPVIRLDAIDSGVALEGLELRGVRLLSK